MWKLFAVLGITKASLSVDTCLFKCSLQNNPKLNSRDVFTYLQDKTQSNFI